MAGIAFGVAFIVIAFASYVETTNAFLWIATIGCLIIGFSSAANVVGE